MAAAKSPTCLPLEQLAEFVAGRVSADRLDLISAHVDTCVSCQATVADLTDDPDSFVVALRAVRQQQPDAEDESACQLMLDRLVEHRSLSGRGPAAAPPMPASIGAYRVLEPIAAGGMGMVYKAQHPKLKRTVAIKLLPLHQWAGSAAVARFEREMEVIGGLDHPNIVRASDAGDVDGMHYLVMDFIDGLDLSRLVRRMGPLPMADACEIVRQTACGLAHVHAASLVHRDIKPSNIMLTQGGHVKILDLGLAMLGQQYREVENNLTTIGQLMGTLDYMAPEQAADSRQVDSRADIYSLGATLFKLLTGQAPYGGPSHRSLLKKVLALASAPVPSIREFRPELPEALDDIVQRCLTKEPEARYMHVSEVAEALAPFAVAHDLTSLMRDAREKADHDPLDAAAWPMHRAALPAEQSTGKPKTEPAARRRRWLVGTLVATAAIAVIALGTVIIRIATDRGELIVRSEDPDARIMITRTEDQSAQEMVVEQGAGKITIKSGHYAVELLGDADRWSVDRNQFTIARGDQVLLQIERREAAQPAALLGASGTGASIGTTARPDALPGTGSLMPSLGSSMMPGGTGSPYGSSMMPGTGSLASGPTPALVYDGKSYDDWLRLIETERNPTRLTEAVTAIGLLAPAGKSEEAASSLLRLMRVFGTRMGSRGDNPQATLVLETWKTLGRLQPEGVVRAFSAEISAGNVNSHAFLLEILNLLTSFRPPSLSPLFAPLAQAAPQMMSELLRMSRDPDATLSSWALRCAACLAVNLQLDIGTIEGFLPRFTEALQSDDEDSSFLAAVVLTEFAPDTPGIAERLADGIGTWSEALPGLYQLGPRAAPALPKLADSLEAIVLRAQGDTGVPVPDLGGKRATGVYGILPWSARSINVDFAFSIVERCAPELGEAMPLLLKLAEQGPFQERAQKLIEQYQTASGRPLKDGEQPPDEGEN